MSAIWGEVLRLDQLGVNDDFLELGGDSLLAGQIVARVIKTFGIEVPMRSLFEAPTVAETTVVISKHQVLEADQQDIERVVAELEALSDEQAK